MCVTALCPITEFLRSVTRLRDFKYSLLIGYVSNRHHLLLTRLSQILHFQEEIVSEDHLLIWWTENIIIHKPGFNIIHFVRMCRYLLIDQYRVFAILNISCSKCKKMGRKCPRSKVVCCLRVFYFPGF